MAPVVPGVRVVVTTRDATLAGVIGAKHLAVPDLSPGQARALLAELLGTDAAELPDQAGELLAQIGGVALAVSMVGSMFADALRRSGPEAAVAAWGAVTSRLATAQMQKVSAELLGYEYASLGAAIDVSVDDLEPDDRLRWAELSVAEDGEPIPVRAVEDLWAAAGLDLLDTSATLRKLEQRSLISDDSDGHLRMHDLLLLVARARLADRAAEAHERLVQASIRRFAQALSMPADTPVAELVAGLSGLTGDDPRWAAIDDYCVRSFSHHLLGAGSVAELHALLSRQSLDGANAWYAVLRRWGLERRFLADVTRARGAVDGSDDALELRYALYEASLRAVHSRLPPSVLEAQLRNGLLDFEAALLDISLEIVPDRVAPKLVCLTRAFRTAAPRCWISALGSAGSRSARPCFARSHPCCPNPSAPRPSPPLARSAIPGFALRHSPH